MTATVHSSLLSCMLQKCSSGLQLYFDTKSLHVAPAWRGKCWLDKSFSPKTFQLPSKKEPNLWFVFFPEKLIDCLCVISGGPTLGPHDLLNKGTMATSILIQAHSGEWSWTPAPGTAALPLCSWPTPINHQWVFQKNLFTHSEHSHLHTLFRVRFLILTFWVLYSVKSFSCKWCVFFILRI